jgi:hypothetical protein
MVPAGGFPAVDVALGAFLAGFIEGEACFTISRQRRGPYGCSMRLCVRDDDGVLLAEMADRTRLGRLRSKAARPPSHAQLDLADEWLWFFSGFATAEAHNWDHGQWCPVLALFPDRGMTTSPFSRSYKDVWRA